MNAKTCTTNCYFCFKFRYGTSDLTGLFLNKRFDLGLVCLLNCLKELGEHAESFDSKYKMPYGIQKSRIGDASIKLQYNTDQDWTKALKYFLIDCHSLIGFFSSNKVPFFY